MCASEVVILVIKKRKLNLLEHQHYKYLIPSEQQSQLENVIKS